MTSRPHRTQRTNALGRTELLLLLAAVAILVAQQLAISNLGRDGAEAAFRRGIFFVTTPMLVIVSVIGICQIQLLVTGRKWTKMKSAD